MRSKIGDWTRVLKLAKEGTGHDDILQNAYSQLGEYFAERYDWENAAKYYNLAKNIDG